MTASEAEALLRKDLKELCSLFRPYGKDSLLLSEIRIRAVIQTKILSQLDFLLY